MQYLTKQNTHSEFSQNWATSNRTKEVRVKPDPLSVCSHAEEKLWLKISLHCWHYPTAPFK